MIAKSTMHPGNLSSGSIAPSRVNNFDFIRLVCASVVIWSHSYILLGQDLDPFLRLTGERAGTIAVSAFFVISGYLVFGSLSSGRSLAFYAASRFLRIIPALVVLCVATVFVLGLPLSTLKAHNYLSTLESWKYLTNAFILPQYCCLPGVFESNPVPSAINGSLWTLSVEVFCYISLALLWFLGLRNLASITCLLAAITAGYIIAVTNGMDWNYPKYILGIQIFGILQNSLYFCIGMFLFSTRNWLPINGPLAAVCVVGIVLGGQMAHLIAVPYLVFYFAFTKFPLRAVTERIGDISYGVYIYGFPVQQTIVHIFDNNLSPTTLTVTALLLSYVLGFASWKLVEKPALSIKALIKKPSSLGDKAA